MGTTALGAVGLCFPIITIILAFSNLFGSGGAPLFSIERGRKDTKESSMIMNTSFFLICVCALLLMAVGMIFAKSDSASVRKFGKRTDLRVSLSDDLSARNFSFYGFYRYESIYQCAGIRHHRDVLW